MSTSHRSLQSYFDFEDRQFTREDHSWLCEKALRDDSAFPTLPRYNAIPQFPLKDIFAKVLGRTEGMFPFLLRVAPDVAVQNLRAFFKAQGFCLKQNTAFTLLKSQQVERSTFQVLSPGLQRKRAKVSVYVTKLASGEDKVIVEFRRSERNPVTVPTEFLNPRDGCVAKSLGVDCVPVALPDLVEYGAGVPPRPGMASFALDSWKEESAKQLVDWYLDPGSAMSTMFLPSLRTVDRASAAVDSMLSQLFQMRSEDRELHSSCKRVKLETTHVPLQDLSGFDLSMAASALPGASYAAASTSPVALWWNLNAPAPSPTRSSFDEMTDFVVRHSQIKPRSETLQDRCDAFCSALRLCEGARVSLLVLEGAEALWDDLTITGRWFAIQRCLAAQGTHCKILLLSNRQLDAEHYNVSFISNVVRLRVPGEPDPVPSLSSAQVIIPTPPARVNYTTSLAAQQPRQITLGHPIGAPQHHQQHHQHQGSTSLMNAANHFQHHPHHQHQSSGLVVMPKFQQLPQQQMPQQPQWFSNSADISVSGSDTYPPGISSPSGSESDEFSTPVEQQSDVHEQTPLEWEWSSPAPAAAQIPQPLMFPMHQAPAHPTLYNIYDAFVASSYPPFDVFARPQAPPMWFTGPPVLQ